MKRLVILLLTSIMVFSVSGCGKKIVQRSLDGTFTISCEGKDSSTPGIKQTNKSVYNFDKDQYPSSYEITTISVFDNKDVYKIYKKSSEETAKSNKEDSIVYNVKGNDKTKTLTFSYKVVVNRTELDKQDNKDFYKASNVLKRAETNSKCTISGIDRNDIK